MESSSRSLPPLDSFRALPAMTPSGRSSLPPPPASTHDGALQTWLQAKSEEDRRAQQEEKTRQETLRLEQRKIEHAMLRDATNYGVPPHMIPCIFTGIGGNNSDSLALSQQHPHHPPQLSSSGYSVPVAQAQAGQASSISMQPRPPINNNYISSSAGTVSRAHNSMLPPSASPSHLALRGEQFEQQPISLNFHHYIPPTQQSQAPPPRSQPVSSTVLFNPFSRSNSEADPNNRSRSSQAAQTLSLPPALHVPVYDSTLHGIVDRPNRTVSDAPTLPFEIRTSVLAVSPPEMRAPCRFGALRLTGSGPTERASDLPNAVHVEIKCEEREGTSTAVCPEPSGAGERFQGELVTPVSRLVIFKNYALTDEIDVVVSLGRVVADSWE
ncbi:hypothetical protein N7468_004798 [Penicillium chermesinum]|uniref:Uncharacterized protein n=1 Tax=Penicillium chermesinum TaxID=63820 RepID=A0A9W9P986_9EURO|nr:uncharacterized protein N7468_004798 [Penicillium chermesinum]KAJ5240179.1 hypothetical protein N7468_004798 [Penicillium chermesinum]